MCDACGEYEDHDDDYEEGEAVEMSVGIQPVRRMQKLDLLVLAVGTAGQAVAVLGNALTSLNYLLVAHANWQSQQQSFADSIREDLEAMPTEPAPKPDTPSWGAYRDDPR